MIGSARRHQPQSFLGTEIQNVLDNTFAGTFQPVNGGRFGASLSSRQMGLTPWSRRSPKTRGPPRTKAIGGGPKSSVHYVKRLLLFSRSQRHERRARRGRWICDNQHQPKRLVSHVSNRCTRHRGSSSRTPNGTRFASISRHALTSGSCTIKEKTGC